MTVEQASGLLQETVRLALVLSAPVLMTALVSGLVISIFQAATQVNEQTLSFVPKIVLTLGVFALLFPWMMGSLVDFANQLLAQVAAGGLSVTIDLPLGAIWALPLATVRTFAMFSTAPVFGHAAVPVRIRVALGFAFALVAAPLAEAPRIDADVSIWMLAGTLASETLIGATLGFALRLVFMVFAPVGELMSVQGGLGAASVLDPASGMSSVVLGVLLQGLAVVVFLAMDGHHTILRGLAASFEWLPLGTGTLTSAHLGAVVGMGASLFELTARLALPVTVVMLVANVGVGILGRAIPQLNLMALQLPAHVAIVLLLLALAAGPLTETISTTLGAFTERTLVLFSGGP